jgi:hypothetical protein
MFPNPRVVKALRLSVKAWSLNYCLMLYRICTEVEFGSGIAKEVDRRVKTN